MKATVTTENVVIYAPNIIVDPASNILVKTIDDGSNLANPDYASLQAAVDGENTHDLAAEDIQIHFVVYPFVDTVPCTITGFGTTDADHHLTVRPVPGTGARAFWQEPGRVFRLAADFGTGGGRALDIRAPFTELFGFEMSMIGGISSFCVWVDDGTTDILIGAVHTRAACADGFNYNIRGRPGTSVTVRNSVIERNLEPATAGTYGILADETVEVANTTIRSRQPLGANGLRATAASATALVRNTVATGFDADAFHPDNDYDPASSNNASSDATAPGANSLTGLTAEECFVDPANGDFRLRAGSPLIGAGADLSGEFETDIARHVREAPYSIGAHQEEYARLTATAQVTGRLQATVEVE